MGVVRRLRRVLFGAVTIVFCGPIASAHSQQRVPGVFGVFGGVMNSVIVEESRREWQKRPVTDYNCLASHNLSADQLAAKGIGPNDPRIRHLLSECEYAVRSASKPTKPQSVATPIAGPNNPNFIVDGLALGGAVDPNSAAYKAYTCRASEDFSGFTWCSDHRAQQGKFGSYTSRVTILHNDANTAVFITQTVVPAFFAPGDAEHEIQRLSQEFGQAAQIRNADPRPDVPHAVLASWGAVTLTPLDEATLEALRRGEQIHRGLVADFLGDAHRSARIGLPVYSIGGGPGYLWGANFDDTGKGALRISTVDARALGPTRPAPDVAVAASAGPPSSRVSEDTSTPSPQEPDKIGDTLEKTAPGAHDARPKRDIRGFRLGMTRQEYAPLRHKLCRKITWPGGAVFSDPDKEPLDTGYGVTFDCYFGDGTALFYSTTSYTKEIYELRMDIHNSNMNCNEFASYLSSNFSIEMTPTPTNKDDCGMKGEDASGYIITSRNGYNSGPAYNYFTIVITNDAVNQRNNEEIEKNRLLNIQKPKL